MISIDGFDTVTFWIGVLEFSEINSLRRAETYSEFSIL
jgi:hypothetical protein